MSLLVETEKSGYDINKQFAGSIGYYWTASHQQIYKTLATMQHDGWVEFRLMEQQGKPDKKFYSITQTGLQELSNWARQPVKPQAERNELLIKLLLADLVGADVIITELEQLLGQQQKTLAEYQHIQSEFFTPEPTTAQTLQCKASFLTLRYGITSTTKNIHWLEEAIDLLK
ncbi:MAG: PadR family transcriptional regulator [Arenicella sp.]